MNRSELYNLISQELSHQDYVKVRAHLNTYFNGSDSNSNNSSSDARTSSANQVNPKLNTQAIEEIRKEFEQKLEESTDIMLYGKVEQR